MTPTKLCPCGTRFRYDPRRGPAEWERRRFCSRNCAGRFGGLAAQVDPDADPDTRLGWTAGLDTQGGAA